MNRTQSSYMGNIDEWGELKDFLIKHGYVVNEGISKFVNVYKEGADIDDTDYFMSRATLDLKGGEFELVLNEYDDLLDDLIRDYMKQRVRDSSPAQDEQTAGSPSTQ